MLWKRTERSFSYLAFGLPIATVLLNLGSIDEIVSHVCAAEETSVSSAAFLEARLDRAPSKATEILALRALVVISGPDLNAALVERIRALAKDAERLENAPGGLVSMCLLLPLLQRSELEGDVDTAAQAEQLCRRILRYQNSDADSHFFGGYSATQRTKEEIFSTTFLLDALATSAREHHKEKEAAVKFVRSCQKTDGELDGAFYRFPSAFAEDRANVDVGLAATLLGLYVLKRHDVSEDAAEVNRARAYLSRRDAPASLARGLADARYYEYYALSLCIRHSLFTDSDKMGTSLRETLLEKRLPDGSWKGEGRFDRDPVAATAYAVLALHNCRP
ncbi:MAG: hypothetical protein HQ581_21645 [Planctomycetes bacterium]|nr:hypothetical protein [Planctomycetota bacterium]